MKEQVYAYALQKVASVGAIRTRRLVEYFGSFETVWKASAKEILQSRTMGPKQAEKMLATRAEIDPEREYERNQKLGVEIVTYWDEHYPPLLKECKHAPAALVYRGVWPTWEKTLAVVGARKCSPYGTNVCREIVGELARQQVQIISGGARGIDSVAHRAALGQAPTIAVLACGLDIVYPPENKELFEQITATGVLISEYALGTPPLGRQFPARNRIISGLSRGVLVVEAAAKSGSLITADFALEDGRDVFAVPGNIFSSQSQGTNHLLRQGAIVVTKAEDILMEYGWSPAEEKEASRNINLTAEQELVYRCCSMEDSVDLESIILRTTFSLQKVTHILLQLELQGLIQNIGNQHYIAISRK